MVTLEEIIEMLKDLKGVVKVFPLDGEFLKGLKEIESNVKASLGISVKNTGLEECLKREHIICIIKNTSFRPPPESTVLLVGDDELIMGQEVLPGQEKHFKDRDDVIWLSDEFVIFVNRRPRKSECFVMPPVSFPELECLDGVKNVVSCSPSAVGDITLRRYYGMDDDPRLASILVGFDLEKDFTGDSTESDEIRSEDIDDTNR